MDKKGCVSPELLLAHHFSQVFNNELSGAKRLLGPDAPTFSFSTESLQTLDPLVPLDVLVVTLVSTWTRTVRALGKAHSKKQMVAFLPSPLLEGIISPKLKNSWEKIQLYQVLISEIQHLLMGNLLKRCSYSVFCHYLFRQSSRQPFSVKFSGGLQLHVVVS